MKAVRGDRPGALTLARQAARKAPRWADPLKLQGDVRLTTGDAGAVVELYARAAKLGPRWGQLHLKWGEARARWRAAASMDLSAADRVALMAKGV